MLAIDLTGQSALVTGGTRGIGAATVRTLHAAGAAVTFTYVASDHAAAALVSEIGDRVAAIKCDVADYDGLPHVVDRCVARFGRLDTLVNNAGIFAENRFGGDDYAAWRRGWERTFAVNTFGPAHLAWLAMRPMRERGGGRIVNVTSRAAHRGELIFADYGASKAALTNLTKSIARSCARDGILAFTIAPGFVETDMATSELEARRAEIEGEIPSGRIARPQDVANAIAFCASPLADHLNGSTLDVNGGSYIR